MRPPQQPFHGSRSAAYKNWDVRCCVPDGLKLRQKDRSSQLIVNIERPHASIPVVRRGNSVRMRIVLDVPDGEVKQTVLYLFSIFEGSCLQPDGPLFPESHVHVRLLAV